MLSGFHARSFVMTPEWSMVSMSWNSAPTYVPPIRCQRGFEVRTRRTLRESAGPRDVLDDHRPDGRAADVVDRA